MKVNRAGTAAVGSRNASVVRAAAAVTLFTSIGSFAV
jgi:hypothetical protein